MTGNFKISEAEHLRSALATYNDRDSLFYRNMKDLTVAAFSGHLNGGSLLELGCGWGYCTRDFAALVDRMISLEGCAEFIEAAQTLASDGKVEFRQMFFEEIDFIEEFDYVVAANILDHVRDHKQILALCRRALKPGGLIYSVTPNARVFSRQMAVAMGLMKDIYEILESERVHGHRRIFDLNLLTGAHREAGFEILKTGALAFKPFADFQMRAIVEAGLIGEAQLEGLAKMAVIYPDISNGIYVIGRKN